MKTLLLTCLITSLVLIGCDQDTQTTTMPERGTGQLIYSFPTHDQGNVATRSPVFLRFSSPITSEDPGQYLLIEQLQGDEGQAVSFTSTLSDDRRTLILTPEQPLAPAARYRVTSAGMASGNRQMSFPPAGIHFATRLASSGPLLGRISPTSEGAEAGFTVLNLIPDGSNFPLTDLASLRMQFNEPLDPQSTRYGDSVRLENAQGELVPAELLVKGQNLTLDPDQDLVPGSQYTLRLTSAIQSTLGGELNPGDYASFTFTPSRAGGRSGIPLQVVPHQQNRYSGLSGGLLNSVNLSSALLGSDNPSYMGPDTGPQGDRPATGDIYTDLASVVRYPDVTPLRVRKGALITGTDVAVKVGGALPAGISSGTVSVRFLSDANGFMVPNPYSTSSTAPKNILLFVDMALNAEAATANAALGQELLNVPLVGTLTMENGALVIDALAVIEPRVLGIDQAAGLVSFRLEGYPDSQSGPVFTPADGTGPQLLSWVPGNNPDSLRPGDPLILYFDQPLKRSSVQGAVQLDDSVAGNLPVTLDVDGSRLVIQPQQPLRHGRTYTLSATGIEGINGKPALVSAKSFTLTATDNSTSALQSPLVLTTLPGYPCAKTASNPNIASSFQGRCAGGRSNNDPLPIQRHPGERPVIVRFSQNMDPDSFQAGTTVLMESNQGEGWQTFNDWVMEVDLREIRLIPLAPWDPDTLYRYTLVSAAGSTGNSIRSESGLPLQTQLLSTSHRALNNRSFGGPNMVNHFRGGDASASTLTPLRNLPAADANSDLMLNASEVGITANSQGQYRASANSAKIDVVPGTVQSDLVTNAAIGCQVGQQCPGNKFLYLTGMLDVNVADTVLNDPSARIAVAVDPSVLYTTGLDVHIRIDDSPQWICFWLCNAAQLVGGANQLAPTGPMLMRMRHSGPERDQPIEGFIFTDTQTGQLTFELALDLYLDAPYLHLDIDLTDLDHNLRSYPINNLVVRGPIDFLDDGRMQINLRNTAPLNLNVAVRGRVLGGLGDIFVGSANTDMTLTIPTGELVLNYLSPHVR